MVSITSRVREHRNTSMRLTNDLSLLKALMCFQFMLVFFLCPVICHGGLKACKKLGIVTLSFYCCIKFIFYRSEVSFNRKFKQ